ncbi:MAG: response regulator, partial [Planctomycetes bacterium]|nr:response regulator [Planctomycetota bacterium]
MKRNKGLILIVDDDPTASLTLKSLLIKDEHKIDIVENGLEAFAYLEDKHPDVILLDVMMPNIDGFEVCSKIKSDKRFESIPVILVTALDSKEELIRGLEAGADEFLTKPVNGPELRARVNSMIRIKHQYNEIEATLELREDLTHIIAKNMSDPLRSILVSLYFLRKNNGNSENSDAGGTAYSETYNSIESQALK